MLFPNWHVTDKDIDLASVAAFWKILYSIVFAFVTKSLVFSIRLNFFNVFHLQQKESNYYDKETKKLTDETKLKQAIDPCSTCKLVFKHVTQHVHMFNVFAPVYALFPSPTRHISSKWVRSLLVTEKSGKSNATSKLPNIAASQTRQPTNQSVFIQW